MSEFFNRRSLFYKQKDHVCLLRPPSCPRFCPKLGQLSLVVKIYADQLEHPAPVVNILFSDWILSRCTPADELSSVDICTVKLVLG